MMSLLTPSHQIIHPSETRAIEVATLSWRKARSRDKETREGFLTPAPADQEETENHADYMSTLRAQAETWLHLLGKEVLLLYKAEILRNGASNSTM